MRFAQEAGQRRLAALLVISLLALGLSACMDSTDAPTPQADTGSLQLALLTDPDPPNAGPATIIVEVKDAQGQPVEGATVNLSTRMENMSHGGLRGQLVDKGAGRYEAAGSFSMSGPWLITVEVAKTGLELTVKTFEVQVR